MGFIFKDADHKRIDPAVARKRAILLSLPFAAVGFIALILLLHDGLLGGLDRQKLFKLSGAIAASIGFVALIFGITGKKGLLDAPASLSENSEKPWLKRADWATGRISSAGIPHARSYLIMGIALCALGGLIAVLAVPKALQSGNYSALVALVFPLVGIGFLTAVLRKIHAHRRFGDCLFEITRTPASLGGTLEGAIRTGLPLKWEGELRVNLFCVRKTTSGAGQNRRTDEKILWQDERIVKSPADLPEPKSGHGEIPVHFDLPADQPPCAARGNREICWRLEMKIPAANFHATFDVPVFKTAGDAVIPKAG